MAGRVDADIRAYKAVVADGDWGFVEYGEVEVRKEAFAYADLLAIVAVEGLDNQNLVIGEICPKRSFRISLAFSFSDGRSKL